MAIITWLFQVVFFSSRFMQLGAPYRHTKHPGSSAPHRHTQHPGSERISDSWSITHMINMTYIEMGNLFA